MTDETRPFTPEDFRVNERGELEVAPPEKGDAVYVSLSWKDELSSPLEDVQNALEQLRARMGEKDAPSLFAADKDCAVEYRPPYKSARKRLYEALGETRKLRRERNTLRFTSEDFKEKTLRQWLDETVKADWRYTRYGSQCEARFRVRREHARRLRADLAPFLALAAASLAGLGVLAVSVLS